MSENALASGGEATTIGGVDNSTEQILSEVLSQEAGQAAQPSTPEQSEPKDFDVEFTWKGKAQKMPWSKARAFVQKGYDYEQNIATLKRERDEFTRERSQFGDLNRLKELKQLDDLSRQHPQFLEMVKGAWNQYNNGSQAQGVEPSNNQPIPNQFQSMIQGLTSRIAELEGRNSEAALEQAIGKLDQELETLKKDYGFLKWDEQDQFGYTPEHQILRYIQNYGVDASKAFWALYGQEVARAKESEAVKRTQDDIKSKHKRGVFIGNALGKSNAMSPAKNLKSKSYDELGKEALASLNITY